MAPAMASAAPSAYTRAVPVPVPNATGGVGVNSATNTVYVGTSSSVLVLDGATNRIAATVAVQAPVTDIAVNSLTNTIYVATRADEVLAVNGQSRQVAATIAIPGLNSAAGTGRARRRLEHQQALHRNLDRSCCRD